MNQEMNDFIHQQNNTYISDKNQINFYTIKGKEDFIDYEHNPRQKEENLYTQAKSHIIKNDRTRYYIRITGDGKPHNPTAEYANVRLPSIFMSKIIKNQIKFKEVNYRVFSMYVNFLKTKNNSWLYNTEREMI